MDRVDAILAQWSRERPDLDVAAMGLFGRLARLSQYLGREMEKTFAAHGLTAAGFDVLATLRRSGAPYSLSPGELLATMMITSGTLTHRIDQLEKAGLVRRATRPEDRRSVVISLTKAGRAAVDAAVGDHVATQTRLAELLSPGDRAALEAVLVRFLAAAEDRAPQ